MARGKKPGDEPAMEEEQVPPGELVVTTFRLRREQLYWLTREAQRRREERRYGRADASAVVRGLIAQAMAKSDDKGKD
jgi:hypothetical protein